MRRKKETLIRKVSPPPDLLGTFADVTELRRSTLLNDRLRRRSRFRDVGKFQRFRKVSFFSLFALFLVTEGHLDPPRQVVISTGKSDWVREVTDEQDSIAQFIRDEYQSSQSTLSTKPSFLNKLARKFSSNVNLSTPSETAPPGVLSQSSSDSLSILNSSFVSSSHHGHKESVMIFPDYKVVHDVEAKKKVAEEMVVQYLSSEAGRVGRGETTESNSLKSW